MPTDQALDEDPDWLHVDVERETFGRGEPGVRTRFGQTNTPDAEIDALPGALVTLTVRRKTATNLYRTPLSILRSARRCPLDAGARRGSYGRRRSTRVGRQTLEPIDQLLACAA